VAANLVSIGSDNLVVVDQLVDESLLAQPAYVSDAVVTFALKDNTGAVLQGPTAMAYVSGSSGRYQGTLTNATAAALADGAACTVEVTATRGGVKLFRKLACTAKYRGNK